MWMSIHVDWPNIHRNICIVSYIILWWCDETCVARRYLYKKRKTNRVCVLYRQTRRTVSNRSAICRIYINIPTRYGGRIIYFLFYFIIFCRKMIEYRVCAIDGFFLLGNDEIIILYTITTRIPIPIIIYMYIGI